MKPHISIRALGVATLCVAATVGANASIVNGSVESANADSTPMGWDNMDSIFGFNRCTVESCGNGTGKALPSSGSAWIWFGGSSAAQSSSLAQNAVIETTSEFLQFDFWAGSTTSNASLTLSIDGTDLWTVTQATASTFAVGYSTVSIALDAWADGGTHAIRWAYSDAATADGAFTDTWSLDNVRLTPVQAIPEPGTVALTGAGLLVLALRASRRRSS